MKETWSDLARDNRQTAQELHASGQLSAARRSIGNRAYYAVYSKLTAELIRAGYPPPPKGGPRHEQLRGPLIQTYLAARFPGRWPTLKSYVTASYYLRINADYRPESPFDERDARHALDLMRKVFDFF